MPRPTRAHRHRRSPRETPRLPAATPGFSPAAVYRPRRPATTPLYRVVQHHLNTFLHRSEEDTGRSVPTWTEKEFRQYLTCGILAHGFARIRCGDCRQERLLAFSCKGRGVCPSCTNRRMAEVAAHLCDRVIPAVPVRQWVLSVPKRLRPHLAGDAALAGAVLRIFLRVIERALRDGVRGPLPAEARCGAVSFLHRFGSGLNPHPHFHLAVTDGLFVRGSSGELDFRTATELDAHAARDLTPILQERILRLYVRRGILLPAEAADMRGWRGTGGFSVDGSVRIAAHDRAGLERLLRYCARPPFALHRLRHATPERPLSSPEARLIYTLPRPAHDGRVALRLAPLELLHRLARLIPPGTDA
jgi:hypothetical protein